MNYPCLCCGYKTMKEQARCSYQCCPIYHWEDDIDALLDPTGTEYNRHTLAQSQKNFELFGVCNINLKRYVRHPIPSEARPLSWKPKVRWTKIDAYVGY